MPRPPAIVLDSMVLINMATARLLEIASGLPEPLVVPPDVVEETVEAGERLGYADASLIRKAIQEGWIRATEKVDERVVRRLQRENRLRRADAAVVALSLKLRAIAGSDDGKVRRVAELEGAACGGTGYLLGRLVMTGKLTRQEAKDRLDAMIGGGWYCDVETYGKLLRQLGL